MKKLSAVVIGYGGRAGIYSQYAADHPDELEIVAIADPNPARQRVAKETHGIPEDRLYTTWTDLAAQPKMADFAIIGTQDRMHYAPAMALIEKGYHLLLEKPMASTPKECKDITEAAERKGVKVVVCHVLRFTPYWRTIKKVIDEGRIGKIISIIASENVGHHSQVSSYVRGPYRDTKESTCMIMAKCCHDLDILQWLIGKKCKYVQSFGRLTYFTHENKPEGSPTYCIDGCPHGETCHYNAVKFYLEDPVTYEWFGPRLASRYDPPITEREALRLDKFGRCVFDCTNDAVDHQVVNMEYEDGTTVSFTMCAFNQGGRYIRIFGTDGELIASAGSDIQLFTFGNMRHSDPKQKWETIPIDSSLGDATSGHGGGDTGIMIDILGLLRGETPSDSVCDVRISYENHLTGFAAEESRLTHKVISLEEYDKRI